MTRPSARHARATVAALALLAGPAATAAAAAAVVNPSFERASATAGVFTSQNDPLPVKGWEFWDPQRQVTPLGDPESGLSTVLGIWRPNREAYPSGAPDGIAVGFLYAAGSGELGLRQVTGTRLTAGTRYLLRVAVGNPRADSQRGFSVTGFPGYRIELRAGGRLLAHEQDRVKPAEGLFVESGVAYTATAADAALGKPIEIRLVNRNARGGAEVDFDAVTLATARASGGGAQLGSGGVQGVVKSGGGSATGGASTGSGGSTGSSAGEATTLDTGTGGASPPPDSAATTNTGSGPSGGAAAPPA